MTSEKLASDPLSTLGSTRFRAHRYTFMRIRRLLSIEGEERVLHSVRIC
jgi:hypothetical protein